MVVVLQLPEIWMRCMDREVAHQMDLIEVIKGKKLDSMMEELQKIGF
jgi:hypothetical protein